jgi:ketosteroid isomerase-like protein
MAMTELDLVVLTRDVPEANLRAGDLGAIVQVYAPDAVEVEFVTASGKTLALQTLSADDVRMVRDDDLLAVRPAARGAT